MQPIIQVTNARKKFFRKLALDNVSLSIPPGVVYALLGENGAGKTTLIRSLLGYYRLQSGSIEVLGMNPAKQPLEIRRRVGYVADQPGMYPWMTVQQVGWFASGFYPEGYAERFVQLAKEFDLPPKTKIRDLSKGMKAKVALSCALAFDPELLIMDEPTSGLDPAVRRSFLESMVDRAAGGKTVLLSSHQIHEVERVADWVAIIHGGKLQVASPLEDLKAACSVISFAQQDILLPIHMPASVTVLSSTRTGRQWECVVRDWTDANTPQFATDTNLLDIQVRRPSLEDLYHAYVDPKCEHASWARSQEPAGNAVPV
ncbi:MAG: ABC transporter ATP-binding protein [Pirellulaceae bacterium]|nr:ABC transporter ATP-binding protein [Pirellulaceae bacterium]